MGAWISLFAERRRPLYRGSAASYDPRMLPRPALRSIVPVLVAAALGGCGSTHPAPPQAAPPMSKASLVGDEWRCTEIGGAAVAAERRPTLTFDSDGKAHGFTSVNRFAGSWSQEGGALRISPLGVTKMGGPPEDMRREADFLKAIGSVDGCTGDARRLELRAGTTVVLRFER